MLPRWHCTWEQRGKGQERENHPVHVLDRHRHHWAFNPALHPNLPSKTGGRRGQKCVLKPETGMVKTPLQRPFRCQGKVRGWAVGTIPFLGSRGHLWSTAALQAAALPMVTARLLSACSSCQRRTEFMPWAVLYPRVNGDKFPSVDTCKLSRL